MYRPDQNSDHTLAHEADRSVQRSVDNAGRAVDATQSTLNKATGAVSDGLDELRDRSESALNHAAARADALSRRGLDSARHASSALRAQARDAGDQAVSYIRGEPVKAVMMAGAAGALLALLLRSRGR